jgi:hypothetical protein
LLDLFELSSYHSRTFNSAVLNQVENGAKRFLFSTRSGRPSGAVCEPKQVGFMPIGRDLARLERDWGRFHRRKNAILSRFHRYRESDDEPNNHATNEKTR